MKNQLGIVFLATVALLCSCKNNRNQRTFVQQVTWVHHPWEKHPQKFPALPGHNYSEHFGNLNKLNTGDEVIITDMNGKSFYFQVVNIETLGAYDSEEMESGDWDLTLFTCTVGGANRVTIRCEATGKSSEIGSVPNVIDAAEKSKHIRK